jgi:chromosome segregation ATPase
LHELETLKSQNEELRAALNAAEQQVEDKTNLLKQLEVELETSSEVVDWTRLINILDLPQPLIGEQKETAFVLALENYKAQFAANLKEITTLKEQLAEGYSKLRESEATVQKLNEVLDQKDAMQSESENTISRLQEDINSIQKTLLEKEMAFSILASESISSEQHSEVLKELEKFKSIEAQKENEIQILLSELNSFKADAVQVVELQHLNQQLKCELEELSGEQLKLKEEICTLTAQLSMDSEGSEQKHITSWVEEKSLLEQELSDLTSRLNEVNQMIADANAANAQWQEYSISLETQLADIQHQFETVSQVNLDLERRMKDNKDFESLQEELTRIQKLNQELEEKLAQANLHLLKESEKLALKEIELQEARAEGSQNFEKMKANEIQLEEQMKILEGIRGQLKSRIEITEALEKRYEILEAEKLQFQNELNAKALEVQECHENLNTAVAQLNDFNAHYYELEQNFNIQTQELQEKVAMISKLEYENTQLLEQTDKKADSNEMDRLASQVVELQAALHEISHREELLKSQLEIKSVANMHKALEEVKGVENASNHSQLYKANQKIKVLERDVATLAGILKSTTVSTDPNGRKISHSEYIKLARRAARVDLLENEIDEISGAIALASLDADNLREALRLIEIPDSVDSFQRLLLNESEAVKQWMDLYQNYQKESQKAKEASQIQIMELREEFDELAVLYDHTLRELEQLKAQLDDHGVIRQGSLAGSFAAQDMAALNKLLVSLEGERNSLNAEAVMMKQKYESLLETKNKELDLLNSKLAKIEVTDRIAMEEYKNRAQSLEFEVKELRMRLQDIGSELQRANHDFRNAEKRIFMLENERTALLDEQLQQKELFDNEMYHAINAEQLRARDHLNFKIKELKSGFDMTLNEMIRKQNQLEQMLDESERLLIADRETFHHREQQLLDELRYLQKEGSARWGYEHRYTDLEQERMHLEEKLHQLHLENRRLRKAIDTQGSHFLKERYDMLSEIATLKAELEAMEFQTKENDQSRIVKTLQEQKSVSMINKGIRVSTKPEGRKASQIGGNVGKRVETTRSEQRSASSRKAKRVIGEDAVSKGNRSAERSTPNQ